MLLNYHCPNRLGGYLKLHIFFSNIGIQHHVSCPHAHEQNGSAETKHWHIVEVGLALLAYCSIPLKFWDDAFIAVVKLINRTPTKVLNYETPLECLIHPKPDYPSLQISGCACWPNLHPYNNHKLQFRSKRCVFLGYSTTKASNVLTQIQVVCTSHRMSPSMNQSSLCKKLK
jgi:hypothetical protein